jgi:hypothetical protein
VRALHEGWTLVLVRECGDDAAQVQHVLDGAA